MENLLEENILLYSEKKGENDYVITVDNKTYSTNMVLFLPEEADLVEVKPEKNKLCFKQEFIDKLSPDNIDTNKFWELATDKFPYFSVAGGIKPHFSIDEVNKSTLTFHKIIGTTDALLDACGMLDGQKLRILEIGPGYGNIMTLLKTIGVDEDYYAIDVVKLFEHPRLYLTDGKTIPDNVPSELEIVYSVNVFQHLSEKQRSSYYKQIYDRLVVGGSFIFGMFVVTEENKDRNCWGHIDEDGNNYCFFFKQLTKVNHIDELYSELYHIGFSKIEKLSPVEEHLNYLTFKVIK